MLLAHWLVTHLLTRVDFVSRPTTCSASCGRWSPPCSSSGARHLAQREARGWSLAWMSAGPSGGVPGVGPGHRPGRRRVGRYQRGRAACSAAHEPDQRL